MQPFRHQLTKPADLDLLAAIWVMSCNDENPIITYKGIVHRLNLSPDKEPHIRSVVGSRPEMFRRGIPGSRLEDYKNKMRVTTLGPSWVRAIADQGARLAAINALTSDDGFRNQFRVQDGKRANIETITWGLEHIERLHKSIAAARDERWKLLNFGAPLLSVIISAGITLFALQASWKQARVAACLQQAQVLLKHWELNARSRDDGFKTFMTEITNVYEMAIKRDANNLREGLRKMRQALHLMEPSIQSQVARDEIWRDYRLFEQLTAELMSQDKAATQEQAAAHEKLASSFHKSLFAVLFTNTPEENAILSGDCLREATSSK